MDPKLNCTIAALLILSMTTGCKKDGDDDPITPAPPANEEELITTLRLSFQSANDVEHKHFTFTDLDGDGGAAPVIDADTLSVDSSYTVAIEVLNESVSPAEDITVEINAEGTLHQFFFQPSGAAISVAYADADGNGQPVGLQSVWNIGAASSGTIAVTLRHGPDKSAAGVSAGDITNAGGESDIEVSFPVVID